MCRQLSCLISLVLVLGLATTSVGQDIAEGLVGYWPLDEGAGATTADASGNGNNGTLVDTPAWVTGKLGGALDFDGSNDAVNCGNSPLLDFGTGDFAISLWIKVDSTQGDATLFGKGGDHSSSALPGVRYQIMFREDDSGDIQPVLDDDSTKLDPDTETYDGLIDQQWHHIVFMRLSGAGDDFTRVYIDGNEDTAYSGKSEATFPAGHDLSGTSLFNAYIGAITHAGDSTPSTVVLEKHFDGMIDDVAVWNRALTVEEILYLWNDGAGNPIDVAPPGQASDPIPADGQDDVARDTALNWSPGDSAPAVNGHTLYLSESFNDVSDGIGGMTLSASSYTPQSRLDLDTTYYWRVDEVDGAPDFTVHPGEVWSFETEPVGLAIANVTATASSSAPEQGPASAVVDGSGLTDDLHSIDSQTMWSSGFGGPQPTWIQFEFDRLYLLHEMWVWNSNTELETAIGYGFKDVVIEYSLDGINYTTLGTTHEFARAPGADGYAHNTTIAFSGVQAKYVKLTVNTNWALWPFPQFGLSEVRFLHIPVRARKPQPDTGINDVPVDVILSWRSGRKAAEHNVYVSTDEQAVIDGTAPVSVATAASLSPSSLNLRSTYYWKVDEVNNVETPAIWQGDIWNLQTQEYLVVDDFESYNDIDDLTDPDSHRIFESWPDGYTDTANGALVGNDPPNPSYAEKAIVHGGAQSMPMVYSNTGLATFSEATRTFAVAQDWAAHGITTLSVYFHGTAGNTGQLYVKINGARIPYEGDPGNIALAGWQLWNIDLTSSGLNLQSVTSLTIGVDGVDTGGKLYFDDIGLHRLAPVSPNEWRIADSADDAEEHGDWDAGAMEDFTSTDMEMPYEDAGMGEIQIIGLRFTGIPIPRSATITEAWVQFHVDETTDGTLPVNLTIEGELSANSATFSDTARDISSRPTTTAQVQWSVPNWVTIGDHGPDQATPSIASIIQEIVNQPGWSGGAIVLMFRDDPASPSQGMRAAVSFDGDPSAAPLLHISYE